MSREFKYVVAAGIAILSLICFMIVATPSPVPAQGGQATQIRSQPEPLPNCPAPSAGQAMQVVWDSTAALFKYCVGLNTWVNFPAIIASGTAALGTSAIASGACAPVTTFSAPGALSTDNIWADFNTDPTVVTGYSPSANGTLSVFKYPAPGNVNFKVCNNTGVSLTPGAISLNYKVVR